MEIDYIKVEKCEEKIRKLFDKLNILECYYVISSQKNGLEIAINHKLIRNIEKLGVLLNEKT